MSIEEALRLENRTLREKNEILEETVLQLKRMLAPADWQPHPCLKLTNKEAQILSFIYARKEIVSQDQLTDVLYGLNPDCDLPDGNNIVVFICRLRKKLAPYGATLDNIRGRGYHLSPESRTILADMNKPELVSLQAPLDINMA